MYNDYRATALRAQTAATDLHLFVLDLDTREPRELRHDDYADADEWLDAWVAWMDANPNLRTVADTRIGDGDDAVTVVTIFTGWGAIVPGEPHMRPAMFSTQIFGGPNSNQTTDWMTWRLACLFHWDTVGGEARAWVHRQPDLG